MGARSTTTEPLANALLLAASVTVSVAWYVPVLVGVNASDEPAPEATVVPASVTHQL